MYDFIEDTYGNADEIEKLLVKLGCQKDECINSHPTRKVFLGGFTDVVRRLRKYFT